jgi:hypothetical protein
VLIRMVSRDEGGVVANGSRAAETENRDDIHAGSQAIGRAPSDDESGISDVNCKSPHTL